MEKVQMYFEAALALSVEKRADFLARNTRELRGQRELWGQGN